MTGRMLPIILALLLAGLAAPRLAARSEAAPAPEAAEAQWHFGFGRRQILPREDSGQPLYIAGYHNGKEITGVLDYCEARAVWLDAGGAGTLLIGIDCVALDSGTVAEIRAGLGDLPGAPDVHVYATHTHAGPDTLGLWGPVGRDGKNAAYMRALIGAATEAAREAAAHPRAGDLYFGQIRTERMCRDSRYPSVYDENLYQLRLAPRGEGAGLRLLFYSAHAESLRGGNTLLSRDYPGGLCDRVTEATGDDALFLPGAIGGLIMTREFVPDMSAGAVQNLNVTADRLAEYARTIPAEAERPLAPRMRAARETFVVPLDNTVFLFYKFLGVLNQRAVPADSATGRGVETELNVLLLDDLALALIPGEIFPELVVGGPYGDANPAGVNPRALRDIAREHGVEDLLIVGLANDELGYIVPPSDFLLNPEQPYLQRTRDARGEDHYEETNSVGPACAECVARAFAAALDRLFPPPD